MKKIIKNVLIWLVLIGLSSSCAIYAKPLVPKLENRTLRIHPEKPGFYYEYCTDYSFWTKKCQEWVTEFWDINNEADRMQLIHMGFKLKVHRRR